MNKPNFKMIAKSVSKAIDKHSPQILLGLGIAGMVTTTILAVKATPKALKAIEDAKEQENKDKLTTVDTVKATWKFYVPAAALGGVSVVCLLGSNSVHQKRTAALATAYKLSETAFTEYRNQVVETIGEKKEQTVRDKVAQQQLEQMPFTRTEVYVTGEGDTTFLEPLSRRYFKSDIEKVRRAENVLNKQMIHDMYGEVTLNEFYDEIGLSPTDVGNNLGWTTEHLIDLDIRPGMTDDGKPCLVVGHYNAPKYHE